LREAFWHDQIDKGLIDVPSLDQESLRSATVSILKRPRARIFLCTRNGAPVGYIYGHTRIIPGARHSVVSIVEELYVTPLVGSATTAFSLMRRVIDALKSAGSERIQCRVLSGNAESRRFVERCGFSLNLLLYEYVDPLN
jgi:L-amino acid N-acyltransferase YncA